MKTQAQIDQAENREFAQAEFESIIDFDPKATDYGNYLSCFEQIECCLDGLPVARQIATARILWNMIQDHRAH